MQHPIIYVQLAVAKAEDFLIVKLNFQPISSYEESLKFKEIYILYIFIKIQLMWCKIGFQPIKSDSNF